MSILVADIKFYKVDDDGNEVLNKEGTHIQLYTLKRDVRFKPLEYLCEDMDDDILVPITEDGKEIMSEAESKFYDTHDTMDTTKLIKEIINENN